MTQDRNRTPTATKWISTDRLKEILEAYGAAPDRWPEDERDAAQALIARSGDARAMRDAAAGLDAALDPLDAPASSDVLAARVRRMPFSVQPLEAHRRMLGASFMHLFSGGWMPVAVGGLGVLLIAAALTLVLRGQDAPVAPPVAMVAPPAVVATATPFLTSMAVVDTVAADATESFTNADLGLDTTFEDPASGDGSSNLGVLTGLAIE